MLRIIILKLIVNECNVVIGTELIRIMVEFSGGLF